MGTDETKIYITLLIAALALAVIISFFTFTILKHQRRSLRLYREKVAAEIRTLEAERKRIASDLHDDLGPLLSAVKLQVASLEAPSDTDQKMVKKISGHLDELVQKIRTTSNDLLPMILLKKGFTTALRHFAGTVNDTGQLYIHLQILAQEQPENEAGVHLYRMVQEMVTNTIRHGRAKNCHIKMETTGEGIRLVVSDDGQGFDFQKISRASLGHGLQNILSRAELLQAKIFIDTAPGKGVVYQIELPTTYYEKQH